MTLPRESDDPHATEASDDIDGQRDCLDLDLRELDRCIAKMAASAKVGPIEPWHLFEAIRAMRDALWDIREVLRLVAEELLTEDDHVGGLPDDLARVLRDQSIIVPQDAAVFELIAKWRDAPPNTATAEVDDGRQPPWIEKGSDLPALHRWASCQLDYLAACSMIVRAGGRRQAAVDAALSAIADRDAALPSALTELRELGPPGTLAPLTLGGRRYGVRCTGLSIELLEPTPQPSEDPCP